jgi:hypothetical protein
MISIAELTPNGQFLVHVIIAFNGEMMDNTVETDRIKCNNKKKQQQM